MKDPHKAFPSLVIIALGIVFGDIGTSPLYAIKEIFNAKHHLLALTDQNIFGILSLVFWTITMVVSVKYIAFIMRANNRGEGGIMALIALASQASIKYPKSKKIIATIGILGACMFYADGIITPAISVLSAVEGLKIAMPTETNFIIPITVIILAILFWAQQWGTQSVGKFFGPIMLLWFIILSGLGIKGICAYPAVLNAINPYYFIYFFIDHPLLSFTTLGAVILCVTGAEALYADMGHLGASPIRLAWFFIVFPSLVLNYFGQGALLLLNPQAIENPFYLLVPQELLTPMIVIATIATIVASQAVISGAFSVSRQALQLGYLPRLKVDHTSESQEGQIYMPRINWAMMIATILLVLEFRSSTNLASAYGIAVTGDMVITSLLATIVFHYLWEWSWWRTLGITVIFLGIDMMFFLANILKVPDGGWVPLVIGFIIFTIMLTWKTGRSILYQQSKKTAVPITNFIQWLLLEPPQQISGNAIFLTPNNKGAPHALIHNLKHNKVIHEKVIILTVKFLDIPHVKNKSHLIVESLPYNFYCVTINYGFKDSPNIPRDLEKASRHGLLTLEKEMTSYFVGKEILLIEDNKKMCHWRKKIFVYLFKSAETFTQQFNLPPDQVIEIGSLISI